MSFLSQLMPEDKKFFFMAGLPRSGSTLLSSILNQNPRIYSGPSSPVLSTIHVIQDHLINNELYHGFPKPQEVTNIIESIAHQYYGDIEKPIIIDKNRAWTSRIPLAKSYITKNVKIIVPVRDIEDILTSFIMMIKRNPYKDGNLKLNFIDEQLVKSNIPITDDNRCKYIGSPNGILGQSLNSIVDCINDGYYDNLHFVEYKNLVEKPSYTLEKLYNFLEEEPFEHSFDSIENLNKENDMEVYGIRDMHEVRKELKSTSINPKKVLSEYILENCKDMDVWRQAVNIQDVDNFSGYIPMNAKQFGVVSEPEITKFGN